MDNLKRIYAWQGTEPSKDVLRGTARKTFQYFGKYLIDFFRIGRVTPRMMDRLVSVRHGEYLQQAHAQGRGVIILAAHFGNWELGGGVVAAQGYPMNVVFKPERLRQQNAFFERQRAARGMNPIPLGRAATGIMRCLRKGELVALLADRDFTRRNDRIDFFGAPARLPVGPSRMAWRTKALVVPAFLSRQVDDTFLLRYHEAIDPREMEDAESMRLATARILEAEIAVQPHQWFVFERFWDESSSDRLRVGGDK